MFMRQVKRYLKIWRILIKLELMTDFQYRLNFLLTFIATTSWVIAEILFIRFVTQKYETIAGWNFNQLNLLLGINQIWVGGFFYFIAWPSLVTFSEMIKEGGADKILTLPINTRFYISVFRISWPSLGIMINGIILTIFSLVKLEVTVTFSSVVLFVIFLLLSCWIIYCIQYIAICITFWLIEAGTYLYLINTFDRLSRFPYEIFIKGSFFILFTFVLPVSIITNVPARTLLGILEWKFVIYALIVAIWLTIVSQIVWKMGLRRYESASS
jgi:ABC-2 type transport system permease protein